MTDNRSISAARSVRGPLAGSSAIESNREDIGRLDMSGEARMLI
jgi:hypothetical protein